MKPILHVKSSQASAAAYRKLLRAEWDVAALDRMLDLVDQQLSGGDCFRLANDGVLFERSVRAVEALTISQTLRAQVEAFERSLVPPLPDSLAPRKKKQDTKRWQQFVRCSSALLLPARCRLEGDTSLLLDSLSMLYLAALESLAPQLEEAGWSEERAVLWNAMWLHAQVAWGRNLAHQQYLLAALFREMDLPEQEERALRNSYSLTAAGEHDFLTKAQAVWACLLDQNRPDEAREFILHVARAAPEGSLAELSDLLSETFVPAKSA
jgi:hypothetical protein